MSHSSSLCLKLLAAAFLAAACTPTITSEPEAQTPTIEVVRQQEILAPLPLRVRLPVSAGVEHVVALYRTWGSRGWTSRELTRDGQVWSGQISCREISTVTGDTHYTFVILDGDGNVVSAAGAPPLSHVATVVRELPGGPQSIPGAQVMRCHDPADCPPDFPGCPAYSILRTTCTSDSQCGGQGCAWDGYCGSPTSPEAAIRPDEDEDASLAVAIRIVARRYKKTAGLAP